jgi:ABC-type glycerol-3-phosphate transport system substrate-binding protein
VFSNKKAAAMLYLDFLRSTEAAKNEWVLELNPRGGRSLWQLPGMLDVPFALVSKELNEIAVIPIIPNKSEIIELLHPTITDALLGKMTAKEALDGLQQLIDLIQD